MKNYIITLLCLLGMGIPAEAQLTEPEVPGTDVTALDSATVVYIYNVEADAFVSYGMNWNTNAIANRLSNGDTAESSRNKCHVCKQSDGTYRLQSEGNTSRFIGTNSGTNDVWIDFTTNYTWTITGKGTNTYNILYGTDLLDVSYANGGHLTTKSGRGNTTWAFIPTAQITDGSYAIYKARKRLYNLYQALVSSGVSTGNASMTAAQTAYESSSATVSSLQTASQTLFKALADQLTEATDVTDLLTNADMTGDKSNSGWSTTSFTYSYADIEYYHKTFTLSQSLSSLPKGLYTVALRSLSRIDGSDATPQMTVAGANTLTANFPDMKKLSWGCNAQGSNGWTESNGNYIPNNMLSAGQALTHDDAVAKVDYAPVTGSMKITVTENSTSNWNNFQNFSLTYTPVSTYLALKKSAAEACQTNYADAAPAILSELENQGSAIDTGITDPLAAYNAGTTIDELVSNAAGTVEPYSELKSLYDEVSAYKGDNASSLTSVLSSARTTMETATTTESLTAAIAELQSAYEEAVRTQSTDGSDMTLLITNPTLVATSTATVPDGWTGTTSSWRWMQGTGDNVMECWNSSAESVSFDMHQTISGLQPGVYEVGCDMMNSTNNETGATFCGGECGLYATTATGHAYAGVMTVSETLAAHSLLIYVREGEDLTIGVKNVNIPSARWFACDNFTLKYRTLENAATELIDAVPTSQANGELVKTMTAAKSTLQSAAGYDNFQALQSAEADVRVSATAYAHVARELASGHPRLSYATTEAQAEYAELRDGYQQMYDYETISGDGEMEVALIRATLAQAIINTNGSLTVLIANNGFENGNTDGWTTTASSDTGARSTSNSTYAATGSEGNWLFNTWWKGTPCKQNIGYLPAGTYRLSAQLTSDGGNIFLTVNDMHNSGNTLTDKTVFTRCNCYFTLDAPASVTIGAVGGSSGGEYQSDGYYWYKADDFELSTATDEDIAEQNVTVDEFRDGYYARGSQDIFGRVSVSESDVAPAETGIVCSSTSHYPTIGNCDAVSTETLSYCGTIYKITGLQPQTAYWVRPYVKLSGTKAIYGPVTKIYTLPKASITYTARTTGNDTYDNNVANAMKLLADYWNRYTSIQGYSPNGGYVSGVATADCSYGGWIRFGSNTSYQQCGTAMHESLHGIGFGTQDRWSTLCNGKNWIGPRVNEFIQFWENSESATFYGDSQHGWCSNSNGGLSYTINGASEDAYSDLQRTANSLLAQACGEDGLPPTSSSWYFAPYYSLVQDDAAMCYIQNKSTGEYLVDSNGTLATSATKDQNAQWNITFNAATQTYYIKSRNGHVLSHENYVWGLDKADSKIVLPETTSRDSYWLATPTTDGKCLDSSLSCVAVDLTGATDANAWVITSATDVNADRLVDIEDVTDMVRYLLDPTQTLSGDTDPDASGATDIDDVNELRDRVLGK